MMGNLCDNCLDLSGDNCSTVKSGNVVYLGPDLPCSTIKTYDTLTVALQKLDAQLCIAAGGGQTLQITLVAGNIATDIGAKFVSSIDPLIYTEILHDMVTSGAFVKIGGLPTEYLMADGSVTTLSTVVDLLITQTIAPGDVFHAPSSDAVYEALLLKADDADVVHKAGDETITGFKTISPLPYATGLFIDMLPVVYNPAIDVPDAFVTSTKGQDGTTGGGIGSVVSGHVAMMQGPKNVGLFVTDSFTPAATQSIGVRVKLQSGGVTNLFYQALIDNTPVFEVNGSGRTLLGGAVDNSTDRLQITGSGIATAWKTAGGTAAQFVKGNGTLDSNVYALASSAHNPVTIGTANGLSLAVQVLSLALANTSTTGALSSVDWNTFNNKQSALSGTGLVKSTAGVISYITDNSANWDIAYAERNRWDGGATGLFPATGRASLGGTTVGQNVFISPNPSAIMFLQANADNTVTWLDAAAFRAAIGAGSAIGGTVTSVAALTIGTVGTDITSSVATPTTTPVITLNVPTASALNRGALSAADWTTFNNKQPLLVNPITGTGTINTVPKFGSATGLVNSSITDNGTGVGGFVAINNYIAGSVTRTIPSGNTIIGQTHIISTTDNTSTLLNRFTADFQEDGVNGYLGVFGVSAVRTILRKTTNQPTSVYTGISSTLFQQNTGSNGTLSAFRATSEGNGTGAVTNLIFYDTHLAAFASSHPITNFLGFNLLFSPNTNVTNAWGIRIGELYGTNASRGIDTNVSSGAGKHNAYFQGTADNYFAGNTMIGNPAGTGAKLTVGGTVNAASGISRGQYINTTNVATANNDVLVALDLLPTFTAGAFTGISRYAIRSTGFLVDSTGKIGTSGAAIGSFSISVNGDIGLLTNGRIVGVSELWGALSSAGDIALRSNTITFKNTTTTFGQFASTTGNLILQNGGTFTDNGVDRLQVTGTIIATGYKIPGGLATQFLMADGSVSTLSTITSGLIAPTIVDGDTTHAPSGDAVFDALALKVSSIVPGTNIAVNSIDPQNPIISAIPATSAGIFDRVYFTGQVASVATPTGPNYDTIRNGKGSVASVSLVSPAIAASTKVFFTNDLIGPAQAVAGSLPIGNFTSFLSVLPSAIAALKRFTIEVFLCDNAGVIIPQAGPPSTDANIFYAGKNTVVILDSGDLTLPASNSTIGLSGYLASIVNVAVGQRFRYHISVARGAGGGAQTMNVNIGSTWNSYIEAPVPLTTSTVLNVSLVSGATATDALNALLATSHAPVTIGTPSGLSIAGQILSLALASTSTVGALSAADWNTFNNKQNAIVNPITGTGTVNTIPKFGSANSLVNGSIIDSGGALTTSSRLNITQLGVSNVFARYTNDDSAFSFESVTDHNRILSANAALNVSKDFVFGGAGAVEFIRIKANGNLLVGTGADTLARLTVGGIVNAVSGLSRGAYINTTNVATANNDVLVGLDINPTFTNGAFTGVSNVGFRTNGLNGFNSAIPTHTITLGSTSTGIALYNTIDQVTNYERGRQFWSGNVFNIMAENGGTGAARDLGLYSGVAGRGITIRRDGGSVGHIQFNIAGNSLAGSVGYNFSGLSATGSSGLQYGLYFTPTITQTATAGYTTLFVTSFENSVGSGIKSLIDVGTNSAVNGTGVHTSKFRVESNGTVTLGTQPITSAGTYNILTINAVSGVVEKILSSGIPVDANLVHKTGDETIAGIKTFTDTPKFATGVIQLNNSDNDGYGSIILNQNRFLFYGKTGAIEALIQPSGFTTYKTPTILGNIFNDNLTQSRSYYLPDQGGVIALTSDITNNDALVVHKAGAETITGTKTFAPVVDQTAVVINLPHSVTTNSDGIQFILHGSDGFGGGLQSANWIQMFGSKNAGILMSPQTGATGNVGVQYSKSAGVTGNEFLKLFDIPSNTSIFLVDDNGNLTANNTTVKGGLTVYNPSAFYESVNFQGLVVAETIIQCAGIQQYEAESDTYIRGGTTTGSIIFDTASTEKMRLTPLGNLLIGSTIDLVSGNKLQVTGNIYASGNISSDATISANTISSNGLLYCTTLNVEDKASVGNIDAWNYGEAFYFNHGDPGSSWNFRSNGVVKMKIDYSGSVGIGTEAPVGKLTILTTANNDGISFKYSDAIGHSKIGVQFDSGTDAGNFMAFNVSNAASSPVVRMILKGDGKVGIGTTGPTEILHVVGNGLFTGKITTSSDSTINLLTIGRGGNNVSTNTALGYQALVFATAASNNNTAVGYQAVYSNAGGNRNTGVGSKALFSIVSGTGNTAVGNGAAASTTTPNENTAVGNTALYFNTTGANNVALGSLSLHYNITGSNNIGIGLSAGQYTPSFAQNTTPNNSIFIGFNASPAGDNQTNQIVIGHQAIGHGDNTVTIGNASVLNNYFTGNIIATGTITPSDRRLKKNIKPLENSLEKVLLLQGVSFDRIDRADKNQIGFIAQDLEEVFPELVLTDNTEEKMKAVNYPAMVAVLVEAMKEQQLQMARMQLEIDLLRTGK